MEKFLIFGQKLYTQNVEKEKIKVIGNARFKRNVMTHILENAGVTMVKGEANIDILVNIGQFISERLEGEHVHSKGHMTIKRDLIAAKQFHSNGTLLVRGELISPSITIRRGKLGMIGIMKHSNCGSLHGEKIEIECIKVGRIVGDVVIIGPQSSVEELVYSREYEIHRTSTVRKIIRMSKKTDFT